MFDQRGATFDPVAVVVIIDPVDRAHFGAVDMAAHYPVDPARARRMGDHLFIVADELDGVLDLVLGDHRQRPIGEAEAAADRVDDHIALHQQ